MEKGKVMEILKNIKNKPNLKTKKFSTLHIELFAQILYSGKTNWDINLVYGYSKKSHCVVDHSRKVMYKLLALENLSREEHKAYVTYPRTYHFWWKRLLVKHKETLFEKAIKPEFYEGRGRVIKQGNNETKTGTWNFYLT